MRSVKCYVRSASAVLDAGNGITCMTAGKEDHIKDEPLQRLF